MPIKYYRLRKNLPTFKAGEVFYLSDAGNLLRESDNIAAYSWTTLDKFPNILTDWFEEIKEQTRWKPERYDEHYYFINALGMVGEDIWSDSVSIDREKFDLGNLFQTKEEAEQVVEYLKALAMVRGDATSKFVKGKGNWYVYYEADNNRLIVNSLYYQINHGVFGLPYFATREGALRSIDLHKKEWLTIFGIEEKK